MRIAGLFCILFSIFSFYTIQAQTSHTAPDNLIEMLLGAHPELFAKVLEKPAMYEVQILYTQINRDKKNNPSFVSHRYRVDTKQYFYPASTVKLPAVLLALEKLNQLHIKGLDKETSLKIDSAYQRQKPVSYDSTSPKGLPTLAHYIKKILLVSDNDAYNRLFEFVGQQGMNEGLYKKGFTDLRLIKRLQIGSTTEEDRYTNPFTFYKGDRIIYKQPLIYNKNEYPNQLTTTSKGRGFMQKNTLVEKPMDFSVEMQM